jgi:Ax21 family sulfation-dependent quorum factor
MKRSLLALTLLAALPFAASAAEGVSYSFVEGGYVQTDLGDTGTDAEGFSIRGSGALTPNFHLFGDYAKQEVDDSDFDFDQWRLGVGYNQEINPRVDLLTRVAYEKFDAGAGIDFDGYSVEAGVRGALTPMLEGYALAGYEDGDELDGDFYGRVGAQVKFNQTWGVNGEVKFADGDRQYFIGPRISF